MNKEKNKQQLKSLDINHLGAITLLLWDRKQQRTKN